MTPNSCFPSNPILSCHFHGTRDICYTREVLVSSPGRYGVNRCWQTSIEAYLYVWQDAMHRFCSLLQRGLSVHHRIIPVIEPYHWELLISGSCCVSSSRTSSRESLISRTASPREQRHLETARLYTEICISICELMTQYSRRHHPNLILMSRARCDFMPPLKR